MKTLLRSLILLLTISLLPAGVFAADLYFGDTDIYKGNGADAPKPNVMFIVDNTQGMQQLGGREAYDPANDYQDPSDTETNYETDAIYERKAATGGTINYQKVYDDFHDLDNGDGTYTCLDAFKAFRDNGAFFGNFKKNNGTCTASQPGNFFLGNQINYINTPYDGGGSWTASTAYSAGDLITVDVSGTDYIFECVTSGTSGASAPASWDIAQSAITDDGTVQWTRPGDLLEMVQSTIKQVADAAKTTAKVGLMTFSHNGTGGKLELSIEDIELTQDEIDAGDTVSANQSAFNTAVDGLTLIPGNSIQPVNEVMWDAGLYFKGPDDFTSSARLGTVGANDGSYTSPIEETCQKNFVILVTTGSQDNDTHLKNRAINDLVPEDLPDDSIYIDDVVKYLNSPSPATANDGLGTLVNGTIVNDQGVQTFIVQLVTPEITRLKDAAAVGGFGEEDGYNHVTNNSELAAALFGAMSSILLETDTAFVAPVVPTSPENRTYSGQRVYLGFFYPKNDEPWYGNLKKFGINTSGVIVDKDGAAATYSDVAFNGTFRDGALDAGTERPASDTYTASSYWSTEDAGNVAEGGVGEILLDRNFTTNPRKIYTYLTESNSAVSAGSEDSDLTAAQNAFSISNANILYDTTFGLADATDKDKLINFITGLDGYDDNNNGDVTEKRPWIMGDVLHSKPAIVNYTSYDFEGTTTVGSDDVPNEEVCTVNKAIIYVGANDGMLHAFRDCDGEENWAFIPPDSLDSLRELRGDKHPYFVDGSPTIYKYDADNDGNIETLDGDKVILLFGMRRGGEAYYALDVTDPDSPEYLWQVDSSSGFSEMGQTWSTPELGVVKYDDSGTMKKAVVAFVGAGYDNLNEDGRYGGTQGFTNAALVETTDTSQDVTSTATVTPTRDGYGGSSLTTNTPKGRGVYAFKVADLDSSGVPTIAASATKIWDFVYSTASSSINSKQYNTTRLTYSIPSDVTVLDTDFDGYTDRLYVGDTGGQMWRISRYYGTEPTDDSYDYRPYASAQIDNWIGKRVLLANGTGDGSAGTNGRKFFYRPSVTYQIGGQINLYFGTGDRAHPLNTAVTERMYALFDKGQITSEEIDEDNLIDVTANDLQSDGFTAAEVTAELNSLVSGYGWFIQLNENDGEKVLAPGLAFNKVAYYTTYAPGAFNASPCDPGNLGTSRLYAVDYLTGEAVLNLNNATNNPTNNNDDPAENDNERADDGHGGILDRTDRSVVLGVGIPSGIVVVLPPTGDAKILIGCGGGLCTEDPVVGGTIFPIYWRPY